MSICPKCKQEYETGVQECADCMVVLVEELESEESEQSAPVSFAFFRAQNEEVLDLMFNSVAHHQHLPVQVTDEIPEKGLKGHFLITPDVTAGQVGRILDTAVPDLIGEGEGLERVYRIYHKGEEHEIRNPEILKKPIFELMEEGEKNIEELAEIVVRGDKNARQRAAFVLASLGEPGAKVLVELLKTAIEKEQNEIVLSLIRVVREEFDAGFAIEEFSPLLEGSEQNKILTLQVYCAFANIKAFPMIIPLLADSSPLVRDEADNALCELSDEDFGFDTEADEDERNKVKANWAAWWERNNYG